MENAPIQYDIVGGADVLFSVWPVDCKYIVDIGCGNGKRAEVYRKINSGCTYVGIEVVPSLAEKAKEHCSSVFIGDIEAMSDDDFLKYSCADCWVFGDVLEHLRDPWRMLSRIRSIIPNNGYIVASIPNAQHWSMQLLLCVGEFDYDDFGLFDRTHLRWFTRITIERMFSNAGFKVVERIPAMSTESMPEGMKDAIRTMTSIVSQDPEIAIADAQPYQYIIRAIPV